MRMYSTESICTNSIRTLLGWGDPRNPSPRTEPSWQANYYLYRKDICIKDTKSAAPSSTNLPPSHPPPCPLVGIQFLLNKENSLEAN